MRTMTELAARRRRGAVADEGFTLVELLCAMFLFAVVLVLISSATLSMVHSLRKEQGQADNLDGARKALELLDHQTRYANAITQPGLGTSSTAQYIEFQTGNTVTAAFPNPPQTCYQWRLNPTTQLLQYRSWPAVASTAAATSGGWQTQLTGAVVSGNTAVFATNALPVGTPAAKNGLLHASLTITFGAKHGNPSTTTTNTLTLTAVDTTSLATNTSVCTPSTIDGGADRP